MYLDYFLNRIFLFFFEQTLTALGKSWHPEHFVCLVCEKPITAVTFNEREGNPVCSDCFAKKYSESCHQCHKPITGVSRNCVIYDLYPRVFNWKWRRCVAYVVIIEWNSDFFLRLLNLETIFVFVYGRNM